MKKINLIAVGLSLLLIGGVCSADTFKVKLNLFERIGIMGMLPAEGNFATLKIVNDLRMELAPSEEEYQKAGLSIMEGGKGIEAKNWLAVKEKELKLGEIAKAIIKDALKKMDEDMKLRNEHMSIYEKFMK